MSLSRMQKLIRFFFGAEKFEKMKEDSKRFRFDCDCGKQSSIWEIGGVRYNAKGKPRAMVKCPGCGKISMREIYKVNE